MGQDVVRALRAALAAEGVAARVPAVLNDTVATLVGGGRGLGALIKFEVIFLIWSFSSHHLAHRLVRAQVALRYSQPDTEMGVILGTGEAA